MQLNKLDCLLLNYIKDLVVSGTCRVFSCNVRGSGAPVEILSFSSIMNCFIVESKAIPVIIGIRHIITDNIYVKMNYKDFEGIFGYSVTWGVGDMLVELYVHDVSKICNIKKYLVCLARHVYDIDIDYRGNYA